MPRTKASPQGLLVLAGKEHEVVKAFAVFAAFLSFGSFGEVVDLMRYGFRPPPYYAPRTIIPTRYKQQADSPAPERKSGRASLCSVLAEMRSSVNLALVKA